MAFRSNVHIIDVWDIETFDTELRESLDRHAETIRCFHDESEKNWLEREASDHTMPYPMNSFASEFIALKEHVMALMEQRTIRAWHYTRLTDDEVATLRVEGIRLASLDFISNRLQAQVEAGLFSRAVADRLYADSPFQSEQHDARSDKFWMVSHPHRIDDGGVVLLLESWGGEAAYFWQRDPELQEVLKSIGHARVIELSVPLEITKHSFAAASAVVATQAKALGCKSDPHAFDLYIYEPLPPSHLLAVHSEGSLSFNTMGVSYPSRSPGLLDQD